MFQFEPWTVVHRLRIYTVSIPCPWPHSRKFPAWHETVWYNPGERLVWEFQKDQQVDQSQNKRTSRELLILLSAKGFSNILLRKCWVNPFVIIHSLRNFILHILYTYVFTFRWARPKVKLWAKAAINLYFPRSAFILCKVQFSHILQNWSKGDERRFFHKQLGQALGTMFLLSYATSLQLLDRSLVTSDLLNGNRDADVCWRCCHGCWTRRQVPLRGQYLDVEGNVSPCLVYEVRWPGFKCNSAIH